VYEAFLEENNSRWGGGAVRVGTSAAVIVSKAIQ